MALLPGVFLRDLQFQDLVRVPQCADQRRHGFTYLKINRTVLDLHDRVVVKTTVQRGEVVVGGPGAIGFQIVPVQMVVIDKSPINQDAPVRL